MGNYLPEGMPAGMPAAPPAGNDYLAEAIEVLHEGMVDEQDPEAIATVSQCLTGLTRLQAKKSQGGGAAQAGGGVDPRQAIMAQLQGQGGM